MNRRVFLQRSGMAALSAGWTGCAPPPLNRSAASSGPPSSCPVLRVRLAAATDPAVGKILTILQDRIQTRCATAVLAANTDAQLIFDLDERLPAEAFRIEQKETAVLIAGGSPRGLLYGAGKFLRTSGYDGVFQPSTWRGFSNPQGAVRGMYFATHFHNWYHQASKQEMARYLEDLALWGVNAVMAVLPMINLQGWKDPQTEPAMAMLRQTVTAAREVGLQFVTGLSNALFAGAPLHIRATPLPDPTRRRGNSGHPICFSHPEGRAYILDTTRQLFENLVDVGLDAVMFWPYDEGGCACAPCSPWGTNGYLRMSRELTQLGRSYFPGLKTIISTWMFDTPPEGEWQGLTRLLSEEGEWLDYILADSHEDFPRYPLDQGVPGGKPLLNFPEISMWGNWPWGGFGAHPLPSRFQRLWDQIKHVAQGGFPYSEGIYEDMNKVVAVQFYWNRDQSSRATLEEYIAYEFGAGVASEVLNLIDTFERTATAAQLKQSVDVDAVRHAAAAAEALHQGFPEWVRNNWRWEIMRLRAILDHERFAGSGLDSPAAENALLRLIELYHCQLESQDPYHHRVRPPLRRAVSLRGKL
ncbi:MAG TPA: hypothetical protein PK843_05440 [bacterium]|nr:hypothetical protein [bacterium]